MINYNQEADRLTAFITDTFHQAGKTTAVIALSGGIDSATSFVLTLKALAPPNVHAYYLPSKTSAPVHLGDCQQLIERFHLPPANFHVLPIGAIIQKSWRLISRHPPQGLLRPAAPKVDKLRLANLAARIRMLVIFDQAKKLDALVIGTENYSEHLLGYYTRFGDQASDLEPIRHLYKTEVIDLARYLEIPPSIIDRPPSADLWPQQTDAAELGFTYQEADPILRLIDQHQTPADIIQAGFDSRLVERVAAQVNRSAFKHRVPYAIK